MFCRYCGKELANSPASCYSCGAIPVSNPGYCPDCSAPTMPLARMCASCGARIEWGHGVGKTADIYDRSFDLTSLSARQRSGFAQHRLAFTLAADGAIILHILTLGLFTLIYFGLMHSKLPMIKHDDFGARRAIGFSFIPGFNLYWAFRFWLRLVDRVSFQLRLRGLRPRISRRFMLATLIVSVIPGVNVAALVMFPMCIAQIQGDFNRIVPEESGELRILLEAV